MEFAKNLLWGIASSLSQQGFLRLSKRRVPSYCEEEAEEKDRKKRRVEPIATPRKDKALSLADTANPHLPNLRTSAPGRNSDPGRAQRSYDASRHTHAFESGGFSFCAPPLERPREKENDHPEAHRFSDSANTRSIAGQRNTLAGPFVGPQLFIFSGRSSLTEITAIPRGLLNPEQLRFADEIEKKRRAQEGHATLRQKATFRLQFRAETILTHTSYLNNNEDVQMIGESKVQSHAAREQDLQKRAQLLLEKERRAAENARDEEQERQRAHDETIRRFEATDGPSLLVKTALLETDNTDLKAKLQQKSTELEDSLQKLEDLRLENLKLKVKARPTA